MSVRFTVYGLKVIGESNQEHVYCKRQSQEGERRVYGV